MRSGTRAALFFAAIAAIVSLAACSGDDDSGSEGATTDGTTTAKTGGDDGEMRATLTDDGCTYDGDETVPAGMFTVEVENQTEHYGAFALAGLAEGSTLEDLEPLLAEAQQQWEQSGTLPELPAFYEQVVRSGVEAGATGSLPADVPAGTYALVCFVDDLPTWRVYAAAQLDVTE